MIRKLTLTNFRRHIDTDIDFDDADRLVFISGANGAGKSTIVEAIGYAVHGEPRTNTAGKRAKVDDLVRRGAEYEGMTVELVFDVDDVTYRVVRKRRGKVSSAVLYVDEVPVVESPDAVTAELTRVLGMDAAGFRLAVVAQQKELDGLASLRPAERSKMLSRLLRLDAVAEARTSARDVHNSERKIVDAMGSGPSVDEADEAVVAAETAVTGSKNAAVDAEGVLADLDAKIAGSTDVEARYSDAIRAETSAKATLEAATAERARIVAALGDVRIPPAPAATRPLDEVLEDQARLAKEIAEGEAAQRQAESLAITIGDHRRVVEQLAAIDSFVAENGTVEEIDSRVAALEAEIGDGEADRERLLGRHQELTEELAAARADKELAARRRAGFDDLGGSCDRCGQDVTDEHRDTELAALDAQITAAGSLIASAETEIAAVQRAGAETRAAVDAARSRLSAARALRSDVAAKSEGRGELERRRDNYEGQIARTPDVDVDVDSLYEKKARLAVEEADARNVADMYRKISAAKDRKAALDVDLAAATERATTAAAALAAAEVPDDLAAAYADRKELVASRAIEAEFAAACRTELARSEERLTAARRDAEGARTLAARREDRVQKAMVAAEAAKLIDAVHSQLSTQLRPDLEAAVTEILATLSDGRFASVKVDDDYDISVFDDGEFRPLSELSGGEVDLVALAVRLGLAAVVSDRAGSGGAGFLILDECLGSQDSSRRAAIVDALGTLRDRYGQILMTSHVGGLEDVADRLVEVAVTAERTAQVAAA